VIVQSLSLDATSSADRELLELLQQWPGGVERYLNFLEGNVGENCHVVAPGELKAFMQTLPAIVEVIEMAR
jgi:hypothetical protein